MVESQEDRDAQDFPVQEGDLVDKDYPGGEDPAAAGSLDGSGSPGGPEVPGEGATEAIGGLTGVAEKAPMATGENEAERDEAGGSGAAEPAADDRGGDGGNGEVGSGRGGLAGGPAAGTQRKSDLSEEDVPDTSAEMPPGRKFGTPGITDGT